MNNLDTTRKKFLDSFPQNLYNIFIEIEKGITFLNPERAYFTLIPTGVKNGSIEPLLCRLWKKGKEVVTIEGIRLSKMFAKFHRAKHATLNNSSIPTRFLSRRKKDSGIQTSP